MDKDYKKLYEEALERARDLHDNNPLGQPLTWTTCEKIFSELRESEDEKIRKEIIKLVQFYYGSSLVCKHTVSMDDMVSWLEKQDTKFQEYINEERNKKDFYCEGKEMSWNEMPLTVRKHDYPYYFKGDLDCYPFNVEKQGKQKPVKSEQNCYRNDGLYYAIDILEKTFGKVEGYQSDDGKMEHQIAIETVNTLYHKKPAEWSEDDEMFLFNIIKDLERLEKESKIEQLKDVYSKEINWLKLRKPQKHWKPSEEYLENPSRKVVTRTNP